MPEKVAYLGPQGTFTEMAAKAVFKKEELTPYPTIPNCMEAVNKEEAQYAVVPIENAIEGSVNLTMDYLYHKELLTIVGEVTIPISQHLMVHPNRQDTWKDIDVVYSHPQAIAQSHHFLKENFPKAKISYTNSTAAAAEWIKSHPEENAAAVGNTLAGCKYGLSIVEQDVHDYQNNHTRFVILSQKPTDFQAGPHERYKTTLMITLPSDYPGALHQVLSAFMWRKINMSKIESRPTKTGLGNYFFIIDVDMKMDDVLLPGVKSELEALGCQVNIIGSYPCYVVKDVLKSCGSAV
ncbi:prephenate dehydratase [Scopulibacillus darangshiensis]|uniref:Prephenate dehydratase n=1 Tax=Scopulibacillus darangshiensis TaxID=442528 RepID=A0A4R2P4W6_9BACL|nr:prephenate dehydratase [Scopulibacillus darangshiensis]